MSLGLLALYLMLAAPFLFFGSMAAYTFYLAYKSEARANASRHWPTAEGKVLTRDAVGIDRKSLGWLGRPQLQVRTVQRFIYDIPAARVIERQDLFGVVGHQGTGNPKSHLGGAL